MTTDGKGLQYLAYDLPVGTDINARLQTRRSDDGGSTWRYSENSVVKNFTVTAGKTGAGEPPSEGLYPGL